MGNEALEQVPEKSGKSVPLSIKQLYLCMPRLEMSSGNTFFPMHLLCWSSQNGPRSLDFDNKRHGVTLAKRSSFTLFAHLTALHAHSEHV